MRLADAGPVAGLIRTAFVSQPVVPDPPMSALRVTAADIVAHLRRGGGGVAEIDGVLAGSALWEVRDGGLYISRVAVAPMFRRRGIARALMAAAEAAARALGLPYLELSTRLVLHGNRRLFAACGFVEGESSAHPGYLAPTSVAMRKQLASATDAIAADVIALDAIATEVIAPDAIALDAIAADGIACGAD